MPKIKPLRSDLKLYLKRRNLDKKFKKQTELFERDLSYPSLNVELLEPKKRRVFSFRIDKKFRAIFVYRNGDVEIIDINPHYE